jgi:hypothetical protein
MRPLRPRPGPPECSRPSRPAAPATTHEHVSRTTLGTAHSEDERADAAVGRSWCRQSSSTPPKRDQDGSQAAVRVDGGIRAYRFGRFGLRRQCTRRAPPWSAASRSSPVSTSATARRRARTSTPNSAARAPPLMAEDHSIGSPAGILLLILLGISSHSRSRSLRSGRCGPSRRHEDGGLTLWVWGACGVGGTTPNSTRLKWSSPLPQGVRVGPHWERKPPSWLTLALDRLRQAGSPRSRRRRSRPGPGRGARASSGSP